MIDPRNEYGFPFPIDEAQVLVMLMFPVHGAQLIAAAVPLSKIERAQAIAAEVRARKFQPVRRLTALDEK